MIDFASRHPAIAIAIVMAGAGAAAAPAWAESSASSASSASSTSVGSASTSIEKSSDSSTKGTNVADGNYRVIDVAQAAGRPGLLRVQLQAVAVAATATGAATAAETGAETSSEAAFVLYLPHEAAQRGGVDRGVVIAARQRPYGLEFSRLSAVEHAGNTSNTSNTKSQQAFFLVLADDWFRELNTTAVTL